MTEYRLSVRYSGDAAAFVKGKSCGQPSPNDNRPVLPFKAFEGNPDFVLSLARGLRVIEAFQDRPNGVTVGEASTITGLSRASVRRLLFTLEALGYATRSGSGYHLSTRVLRLGFAFLSSHSLATLAVPVLEQISATLHESSSVGVIEGDEVVYLARSATNRVMSVGLSVGSRLPAYCTSLGRVLLSALPDAELSAYLDRVDLKSHTPKTITGKKALIAEIKRVRTQGHSIVDEELELGLRSMAVPVVTRSGRTVAAMNTGVHASRVGIEDLKKRFLPVLKESALSLGHALA